MRRQIQYRLALATVTLLAAYPVFAQNDPFKSAPAPTPPISRHAAPHPTDPIPLESAPLPRSLISFDGVWTGTYSCTAYQQKAEYSYRFVLRIKDGRAVERVDAPSRTPGTPGYQTVDGMIDAAGKVTIIRSGISNGTPTGALPRGEAFSDETDGQFIGNEFNGKVVSSARPCTLRLTRQP